MLACMKL